MALVIWAQFYLINWKRKCSELTIFWDNFSEGYENDNQRKEFKGEFRYSPITEKLEKYYPSIKHKLQIFVGILMMLPFFVVSMYMNAAFLNCDGTIKQGSALNFPILSELNKPGRIFEFGGVFYILLEIIYAQAIAFLNAKFQKLAIYTTIKENHRFKSSHENSLVLKRYVFEFFDSYFCFFYIAFVNQDFTMLKSQMVSHSIYTL